MPPTRGESGNWWPADLGWASSTGAQNGVRYAYFAEARRLAIEIGEDPDTREWAMHMILVARALERIGDNAVDIGEQVAFVVTGLFREFSDSSRPPGTPGAAGL